VVRAWGHYLAGVLWTIHRVHAGGTADFPFYSLGEVSASGSRTYFPVVYAIKEPLPWHLLSAWALLLALARVWSSAWGVWPLLDWLRGHPAEICMLGWLVLYRGVAIQSNLNIGVRHLLPVFPFAMGLGRICKLGRTRYLAEYYAPRRLDQRAMGAAATATPASKTQDRTPSGRPSPHPQWYVVDSAHRCPLA
jgi:hypothetical protein